MLIKQFEKLTRKEIGLLLKAPVLVSVLAASKDQEISNDEKAEAVKLAHLKTFTAHPLLLPYYKEVKKIFNKCFSTLAKKYAPFNDEKLRVLKQEINSVNSIIEKLDKKGAIALCASLSGYAEHIRKAEHNVAMDFLFPLPIKGIIY